MIHTAKGLIGVLNNTLLTITSKGIIKWNIEDASIIQKVDCTFKENLIIMMLEAKMGEYL